MCVVTGVVSTEFGVGIDSGEDGSSGASLITIKWLRVRAAQ